MTRRRQSGNQHFGPLVKEIREEKGLKLTEIIGRIYDESESSELRSEQWLRNLEQGRVKKISRDDIERICRALECTPEQKLQLLMAADRMILCEPNGDITEDALLLNRAIYTLYNSPEVRQAMADLRQDRVVEKLNDEEILEIVAEVIALVRRKTEDMR